MKFLILLLLLLCLPALADAAKIDGWVATELGTVDEMMKVAAVSQNDTVYDLGSGDGRIVIAAAKRGAYAVGFEIDRRLVELSQDNIGRAGLTRTAKIIEQDIFKTALWPATVITVFFSIKSLAMLEAKLRSEPMRGTRIVSNGFPIGSWKAFKTIDRKVCRETKCYPFPVYLYEVGK